MSRQSVVFVLALLVSASSVSSVCGQYVHPISTPGLSKADPELSGMWQFSKINRTLIMDYLKVSLGRLPVEFEIDKHNLVVTVTSQLDEVLNADGSLKDHQVVISFCTPSRESMRKYGGFPWRPAESEMPFRIPQPVLPGATEFSPEPPVADRVPQSIARWPGAQEDDPGNDDKPVLQPFSLEVDEQVPPSSPIPQALLQINALVSNRNEIGVLFAWPTRVKQRRFLNIRKNGTAPDLFPEFHLAGREQEVGEARLVSCQNPDQEGEAPGPPIFMPVDPFGCDPVHYEVAEYVIDGDLLIVKVLSPTARLRISKELKDEYSSADLLLKIMSTRPDEFIELYRFKKLAPPSIVAPK